jgi:hypothetical protein
MIPLLLITAASGMASPSVVDAERSYAQMAQSMGQWTAFRTTAAPQAIIFVPDPVNAATWLRGKTDPQVAVKWQPAEAFVACDGKTAATTGPWQRPTSSGYFTTIWSRSDGKWQWALDFGDALEKTPGPAPTRVPVRRASCAAVGAAKPPLPSHAAKSGAGSSEDHSLQWLWQVEADGARHLLVFLWNGKMFKTVIDKTITAAS